MSSLTIVNPTSYHARFMGFVRSEVVESKAKEYRDLKAQYKNLGLFKYLCCSRKLRREVVALNEYLHAVSSGCSRNLIQSDDMVKLRAAIDLYWDVRCSHFPTIKNLSKPH
jgi:hypothetical protein